ncbi:MAG TPA: penicillin-binding protein 2 [Anaeromyxobacteraceae bacterium]|jgi:penicillin-binding protein 2|nr:penicillin-binding protein 2 [Anaeromyxobacteraceae bacterium]
MPVVPPTAPGTAQRALKPRTYWMGAVATLAFLVLLGRLYHLQILHGDEYKERADENFVKELRVPADRGLVIDRNHKVLVDSRPSYDVTLTPYFCAKRCPEVVSQLSALLSFEPDELERAQGRLAASRGLARFKPFTVKVDITREELDLFEAHKLDLPGVDVQPTPHRNYRYGASSGHLVGYMNEIGADEMERLNEEMRDAGSSALPYQLGDYIGRRGLERRFEAELRGVDGKKRVVVDARGNAKPESSLIPEDQRFEASRPGLNAVLSIDWRLQEFAEKTFPATAGVVLAMDPRTGYILALVDRPAPDPNKLSGRITRKELEAIRKDPLQPELFRAIQQHYHPGSTFKVVTSIAALEEGVFKPGGTVYCPGYFFLGGHRWRCDKEKGHGTIDLEHALGASCDVFFYDLGNRLGADRISKWGNLLGLGHPTGFDLAGEISGVMPDAAWHQKHIPGGYAHGMSVNLAIGQGDVNVTPMQQAVLYGALASGVVWKPQAVLRLEDAKGQTVKDFPPAERGRLNLKPGTREEVLKGLEAAVNEPFGTAYAQRLKDVKMAGKTGTAQVVALGAHRLKAWQMGYFERDHAWFAAFAPLEAPEIVVVVLNEHAGFGASNAAPTASAVVKYWFDLQKQDQAAKLAAEQQAANGGVPLAPALVSAPAGTAAATPLAAAPIQPVGAVVIPAAAGAPSPSPARARHGAEPSTPSPGEGQGGAASRTAKPSAPAAPGIAPAGGDGAETPAPRTSTPTPGGNRGA